MEYAFVLHKIVPLIVLVLVKKSQGKQKIASTPTQYPPIFKTSHNSTQVSLRDGGTAHLLHGKLTFMQPEEGEAISSSQKPEKKNSIQI
jgi:hypothetical protein